eukprot:m.314830 g.314830  ORF g.314830 m.314830 type:complete len:305 (+) comp55423_c0_seq2:4501-5415(+)
MKVRELMLAAKLYFAIAAEHEDVHRLSDEHGKPLHFLRARARLLGNTHNDELMGIGHLTGQRGCVQISDFAEESKHIALERLNITRSLILTESILALEEDECGEHPNANILADRPLLAAVDCGDSDHALHFLSELAPGRSKLVAVTASCGVEIDEPTVLGLHDQILEVCVRNCFDLRIVIIETKVFFVVLPRIVLLPSIEPLLQSLLTVGVIFFPQFGVLEDFEGSINFDELFVRCGIVWVFIWMLFESKLLESAPQLAQICIARDAKQLVVVSCESDAAHAQQEHGNQSLHGSLQAQRARVRT